MFLFATFVKTLKLPTLLFLLFLTFLLLTASVHIVSRCRELLTEHAVTTQGE